MVDSTDRCTSLVIHCCVWNENVNTGGLLCVAPDEVDLNFPEIKNSAIFLNGNRKSVFNETILQTLLINHI